MAREWNVSMPYSLCCASSKSARVLANSVRLRLGYSRRNRPTGVSVWFLPQANTSVASGNLREVSLYVSLLRITSSMDSGALTFSWVHTHVGISALGLADDLDRHCYPAKAYW